MRIGIALPQYGIDGAPEADLPALLVDTARLAEALGLEGVWLSDHPFAVAPDGTVAGALEPLVAMGALARVTRRIAVGTLVLAATMRNPGFLAHAARTLETAAEGRIVLGLGTGWYEPEHRAFGIPLPSYRKRVELLGSSLAAVAGLGAGRPALLVGGTGTAVLELAARYADGWNVAWDVPTVRFQALSRGLDAACARAGRDPRTLRRSVGVTVLVARNGRGIDAAVGRLRARAAFLAGVTREALEERIVCGDPAACAERIAAYEADEVVIAPLLRDDGEMVELIATGVAPLLRDPGRR